MKKTKPRQAKNFQSFMLAIIEQSQADSPKKATAGFDKINLVKCFCKIISVKIVETSASY